MHVITHGSDCEISCKLREKCGVELCEKRFELCEKLREERCEIERARAARNGRCRHDWWRGRIATTSSPSTTANRTPPTAAASSSTASNRGCRKHIVPGLR